MRDPSSFNRFRVFDYVDDFLLRIDTIHLWLIAYCSGLLVAGSVRRCNVVFWILSGHYNLLNIFEKLSEFRVTEIFAAQEVKKVFDIMMS